MFPALARGSPRSYRCLLALVVDVRDEGASYFEEDYTDRIVQIMAGEGETWLTPRKRLIAAPVTRPAEAAPAASRAEPPSSPRLAT
jgi:hypothetical protein